jgi:fructokinase
VNPARTIIGLGEVLWDMFPDGPRFGGAPANFACMAADLAGSSARVHMASAVGNDDLGSRALAELQAHGVDTATVPAIDVPTGQVKVRLDAAGHAEYEIATNVAWDAIRWSEELRALAQIADAVCFGSLAQRAEISRTSIQAFVKETPAGCLRIFDVNLRPPFWTPDVLLQSLKLATVVKVNDQELPALAELLAIGGSVDEQLRSIRRRYGLQVVALTMGNRGSILVDERGESKQPALPVTVADTVGAGDAFTAALTVGLLAGRPLDNVHRLAARAAAHVCEQPGASPHLPSEFRQQFASNPARVSETERLT